MKPINRIEARSQSTMCGVLQHRPINEKGRDKEADKLKMYTYVTHLSAETIVEIKG